MVPILVDTSRIAPVPDSKLMGSDCSHCGKARAQWLFYPSDGPQEKGALFICSICWLYDSEWSKNRRADLDAMIIEVETSLGRPFLRDKGQLVDCKDADRIMGAITYLSKMVEMRDRAMK